MSIERLRRDFKKIYGYDAPNKSSRDFLVNKFNKASDLCDDAENSRIHWLSAHSKTECQWY